MRTAIAPLCRINLEATPAGETRHQYTMVVAHATNANSTPSFLTNINPPISHGAGLLQLICGLIVHSNSAKIVPATNALCGMSAYPPTLNRVDTAGNRAKRAVTPSATGLETKSSAVTGHALSPRDSQTISRRVSQFDRRVLLFGAA